MLSMRKAKVMLQTALVPGTLYIQLVPARGVYRNLLHIAAVTCHAYADQ